MPKVGRVGNMRVRFPKGSNGMTPKARVALSKLMSGRKKLRQDKKCTIFFVRGGTQAIQRCEDRHLKATNRTQCRRGGTNKRTKYLFAPCGPGKRRGRRK